MISLITVNYKSFQNIKKLWKSLEKSTFQDFELIIVDNSSKTSEIVQFENLFLKEKKVCYLKLGKNLGFGAGNKEGVRFAQGEFLAFINPDIEVFPKTLEILLNNFKPQEENLGIIAPILFDPEGNLQENWRKFPTIFDLISRRTLQNKKKHTKKIPRLPKNKFSVDWIQGSFLLMRKDFFSKVLGGFDPRFFLFMEDIDLCKKCHEQDFDVFIDPQAKATHGANRLSGGIFYRALFKKTFWLHLIAAGKYFLKHRKG